MGVAGAGLASSLAIGVGVLLMLYYFLRLESYVALDRSQLVPRPAVLRSMLRIGVPSGGEFFLLFIYTATIYWLIRPFGTEAQAGFGIGMRVMQSVFLPAMALSFAVPAVAGQNFGARLPDRVRDTLRQALILECGLMLALAVMCHLIPQTLVGAFTGDPRVAEVGANFLQTISTNFVAMGFVLACSGMFQAMGNTWPGLLSSATRLVTFILPALYLSRQPGFALQQVWNLSVATVILQAVVSGLLVRSQLRQRLRGLETVVPLSSPAST
jgi:putative MATE family efflux protein